MISKFQTCIIGSLITLFNSASGAEVTPLKGNENLSKIIKNSRFVGETDPFLCPTVKQKIDLGGCKGVVYSLEIHDLHLGPNQKVALYTMSTVGDLNKVSDGFVDRNSRIVLNNPKFSCYLEEFPLAIASTAAGESTDIILATQNFEKGASTHIVLNPIQATLPHGQKVVLELRAADGSYFECIGEGFYAEEELKCQVNTENKQDEFEFRVDEHGTFGFIFTPKVEGIANGRATLKITRKNGETLSLRHVWGKDNIQSTITGSIEDHFPRGT